MTRGRGPQYNKGGNTMRKKYNDNHDGIHHSHPASQVTAHEVDSRWNDDNDDIMTRAGQQ
jgi:hypothetical protein